MWWNVEELRAASSSCTAAKMIDKQTNNLCCKRISDDLKKSKCFITICPKIHHHLPLSLTPQESKWDPVMKCFLVSASSSAALTPVQLRRVSECCWRDATAWAWWVIHRLVTPRSEAAFSFPSLTHAHSWNQSKTNEDGCACKCDCASFRSLWHWSVPVEMGETDRCRWFVSASCIDCA